MDFYPDVLDHIGKTPREFGDTHVHLEEVARAPGDARAIATVLIQGAFEPMSAPARLRFFASGGEELDAAVAQFEAPPLRNGTVVRVRYPMALPLTATQVFLLVDASVTEDAQRVRPAWKLSDTIEIPKLSEMEPVYSDDVGFDVGSSAFHSVLSGGVVLAFRTGVKVDAAASRMIRHKAQELPPGLTAAVVEKGFAAMGAPDVEVLWKQGMALPDAAPTPAWQNVDTANRVPSPSAIRRCIQCGFEGKREDYGSARLCPVCDAVWD